MRRGKNESFLGSMMPELKLVDRFVCENDSIVYLGRGVDGIRIAVKSRKGAINWQRLAR